MSLPGGKPSAFKYGSHPFNPTLFYFIYEEYLSEWRLQSILIWKNSYLNATIFFISQKIKDSLQ